MEVSINDQNGKAAENEGGRIADEHQKEDNGVKQNESI